MQLQQRSEQLQEVAETGILSWLPFSATLQDAGRAAVSVAWGPWGGAGMVAADRGLAARLRRQGGLQALSEGALTSRNRCFMRHSSSGCVRRLCRQINALISPKADGHGRSLHAR